MLAATFLIAVSGLVYELIAGAASSYLLGDSIYQFSLVIGLFMTAMGLGAYLSRHVSKPEQAFVTAQIALGLIGGFSAPILFMAFAVIENYSVFLFLVCVICGALVGLEIPLIIRILEGRDALKVTISNVLTADYIGALAAALLFPLVLVPQLGLMGASLLFGGLNLAVAAMALWLFRAHVGLAPRLVLVGAGIAIVLGAIWSERAMSFMERALYQGEMIHTSQSAYQRIVVTRSGARTRLFLDGSLQFDTIDEHRYHEALTHPAMIRAPRINEVLILGGGDGMAVREVLRYPEVERVTLVDLDPAVTGLFRDNPSLAALNGGALDDARVRVINTDAWEYLKAKGPLYDVAILDLPDPKNITLSKLYSRVFYHDLMKRMAAGGVVTTQATSPLFAREAYWTIAATLAATENPLVQGETLNTRPYHAYVPSFGDWGFVMAGALLSPEPRRALPEGLTFFAEGEPEALFDFAADSGPLEMTPNTLFEHPLPRRYEAGWERWRL